MPSRTGAAAAVASAFALLAVALPASSSAAAQQTYRAAGQLQCASTLGGLDGAVNARSRREGTAMQQLTPDTTIPAGQEPRLQAAFGATVPVYFHVVAKNRTAAGGWVSDAQIAQQIDVLNKAYSGGYGGPDSGFRFTLAGVDRTVNKRWFDGAADPATERAMKRALKQGGPTDLNLYSAAPAGLLGFAYFPSIVAQPLNRVLDGVVIAFDSVPGGTATNYDLGQTATHETGHWLGLEHTFNLGCLWPGDFVADTPAERTATSGCPAGKDTCPAPGDDPIHNYMDYSYDQCYTEFTPGQVMREQNQYTYWRLRNAA